MKHSAIVVLIWVFVVLLSAAHAQQSEISPDRIFTPVHFDVSVPLKDVTIIPPGERKRSWKENTIKNKFGFLEEFKKPSTFQGPDPVLQEKNGEMNPVKAVVQNFDGVPNLSGVAPPDTDGDVGPNHYFQMINLSFQIFDKQGNSLYGPADNQTLWEGFDNGQPFDNANDGDPIVIYDEYADRWLASQFVLNSTNSSYYELVAVSATPDPTGAWYRYAFEFTNFPDYPKIGVWSDGYYMAINQFANAASWAGGGACVMDRDAMIAGDPTATMVFFNLGTSYGSLLPADADGALLPPSGSPGYFVAMDPGLLRVWHVNMNWSSPSSSTITLASNLTTSSFTYSGISVTQPGTTQILDNLSDRLMFRLQYRNFGTHQSMVTNHTVNVGSARAGVRWYELRNTGSGWTIYQQGTYAPADGLHRWMGSVAMNANGDIGLGYSVSGTSVYPSIRYTGRLAADPLGTMTLSEQTILAGTASQTGVNRWGDYSAMTVDPADDYTFWYTQEYTSGGWNWRTRIASFQFGNPPLLAQFTASSTSVCSGGAVTFTDQSIGSPTSWSWSFPGGVPASFNGENPTPVIYNTPGTYDVSLTVTKGAGSDTETKTGYITVQNIFADFTGSPTTVVVGNTVTFTDNSCCNPTSWNWSFPGGSPSTASGQGPHTVTYNTIGTFNASLMATNAGGSDTELKTAYIQVIAPVFNMTNGTITTCTGNFYDSGGSSGSYQDNENFTETFYPSTSGAMIQFVFSSFSTEQNYDFLRIYNGTNTGAPLIGTYSGTISPGTIIASNPAGALTFNFTSDYSITASGWAASISCIVPAYPGLWTGNTSTNWSTASNWDNNTVPTAGVDVTIPAFAPNWPTRTGDLVLGTTCNNLTMAGSSELTVTGDLSINSGKSLTCNANGILHIGGDWINNGSFYPGTGEVLFDGSLAGVINVPTGTQTNYLINDNFSSWPGNWNGDVSGGAGYFGTSSTNLSGGSSPEAKFTRNDQTLSTTRRMYHDPLNTTGLTSATLGFKHYVDRRNSPNYTLTAQYSNNGTTWTNIPGFSVNNPPADFGGTVTLSLSSSVGLGAESYYVAFTITGDIRTINAWYIDDVQLSYTSSTSGEEQFYDLTISKTGSEIATAAHVTVSNDMVVNPGAWFTNSSGNELNVSGNMLLEANETAMASFINNGTASVANKTFVQQYLEYNPLTGEDWQWHLVSAPISDAAIDTYFDMYLYEYLEPTNAWYNWMEPVTQPMSVGTGYYVTGSEQYIGTTTVSFETNPSGIPPGVLNNGDVIIENLSYTPTAGKPGFNLVGNPFPCAINWDGTWGNDLNLSGWAVVLDHGVYRGWNPFLTGNDRIFNGKTDGIIPSTQGFWVRALASGVDLTIPLAARTHHQQSFYKEAEESTLPSVRLAVSNGTLSDETVIIFHPEGNHGFDGKYDLEKFIYPANRPNLYTCVGAKNYAVNILPEDFEDMVVPLHFEVPAPGLFVLETSNAGNFPDHINIYLEDLKEGTQTELKSNPHYEFTHSLNNDAHRFNLHFKDSYSGVEDISLSSVRVYSNRDMVYVRTPFHLKGEILVYDIMGQEMKQMQLDESGYTALRIDAGIGYYLVRVKSNNSVTGTKVFIQ